MLGSTVYERRLTGEEMDLLSGLGEEGWAGIASLARSHTVRGLVYSALDSLPQEIAVPDSVLLPLLSDSVRCERRGETVLAAARKETERLEALGLSPLVFKGPAVAALYPQPSLREPGDVDLFVPDFPSGAFPCGRTAPDGSVQYSVGGVAFDVHRKYYDLKEADSSLLDPGSPEGVLLMLSAHILKHLCSTGVGMKQLCDIARARLVLKPDEAALDAAVRRCGLSRWEKALGGFLQAWREADITVDSPLLRVIFRDGNFGSGRASRAAALGLSPLGRKADTLLRIAGRLPLSLRFAPAQTFSYIGSLLKGNLT